MAKFKISEMSNHHEITHSPKMIKMREKMDALSTIDEVRYRALHTKNLVPLNLKIDCDAFEQEISLLKPKFEQWGNTNLHIPRYGLGLVDLESPISATPSLVNWSIDVWNIENPDTPIIDTDFTVPTENFNNLLSLTPYRYFQNHYARSNILWWQNGGHFKPHYDVAIPAFLLRLWGTNDPDNNHFCFWDEEQNDFIEEKNIERGRLYLADTAKVHHAYSTANDVYTFFFSLQTSAYDLIKHIIL